MCSADSCVSTAIFPPMTSYTGTQGRGGTVSLNNSKQFKPLCNVSSVIHGYGSCGSGNMLRVLLYKNYILTDIVLGYMQLKPQLSYIWKEDA